MSFEYRVVDLTHTVTPEIPTWSGGCGFRHEVKKDYDNGGFRVQQFKMHAGLGTHMDAPAHRIPNGATIDALELNQLVAPSVMIDVSAKAHETYSASAEDVREFEQAHGEIEKGSFVIFYTGWEKRWHDSNAYINGHVFPSIAATAAELLMERKTVGVGIDTISPDRPDSGFPIHDLFLGAGKYIVENVANARSLPPVGSFTLALPIKLEGAAEAPIRLIGLVK